MYQNLRSAAYAIEPGYCTAALISAAPSKLIVRRTTMECGLFSAASGPSIPVSISMKDFRGCRTAMFGKTRLGKSNVVKLLAQGTIDATHGEKPEDSVGQLVFDINGEYANDN